jgi:hypothetical protein
VKMVDGREARRCSCGREAEMAGQWNGIAAVGRRAPRMEGPMASRMEGDPSAIQGGSDDRGDCFPLPTAGVDSIMFPCIGRAHRGGEDRGDKSGRWAVKPQCTRGRGAAAAEPSRAVRRLNGMAMD